MSSLIFFGSDQYSATVLSRLFTADNSLFTAVITDQQRAPNPVEQLAQQHNLKVLYYPSIQTDLITKDTLGLCASFDHLLPASIIELFRGRLYNLHPSLLPQYRNVAPVPYAIALGETVTGITLYRIGAGIDNGEIITQTTEPIHSQDTSPILLHRLFTRGAELFIHSLQSNFLPTTTKLWPATIPLIFTHRLTSIDGHVEWPVLQKLLSHASIQPTDTKNPLLHLRLVHNPQGTILHDLVRGLAGWERVWTIAPTKKGETRLTIESVLPSLTIKLAGRPKAISYNDFNKYYL